eukprot:scaffold2945_cov244-Pinguiococcus_pyrenoidosus.AAC.7
MLRHAHHHDNILSCVWDDCCYGSQKTGVPLDDCWMSDGRTSDTTAIRRSGVGSVSPPQQRHDDSSSTALQKRSPRLRERSFRCIAMLESEEEDFQLPSLFARFFPLFLHSVTPEKAPPK